MGQYPVRLSIKAVIIHDGLLLCIKHNEQGNIYYTLPGGGQEFGESIIDAVKRECYEETHIRVKPGAVMFVRDYIGKNHEFAWKHGDFHQVEIMLQCDIENPADAAIGNNPDTTQVGIEWIRISELAGLPFYPRIVRKKIIEHQSGKCSCEYLGDSN